MKLDTWMNFKNLNLISRLSGTLSFKKINRIFDHQFYQILLTLYSLCLWICKHSMLARLEIIKITLCNEMLDSNYSKVCICQAGSKHQSESADLVVFSVKMKCQKEIGAKYFFYLPNLWHNIKLKQITATLKEWKGCFIKPHRLKDRWMLEWNKQFLNIM